MKNTCRCCSTWCTTLTNKLKRKLRSCYLQLHRSLMMGIGHYLRCRRLTRWRLSMRSMRLISMRSLIRVRNKSLNWLRSWKDRYRLGHNISSRWVAQEIRIELGMMKMISRYHQQWTECKFARSSTKTLRRELYSYSKPFTDSHQLYMTFNLCARS